MPIDAAILTSVRRLLRELRVYQDVVLAELGANGAAVARAARLVERAWSGSPAGYHAELYYRNFEAPPMDKRFNVEWGGLRGIPEGWAQRDPEQVRARIEELAGLGIYLSQVEQQAKVAREKLIDFRDEIDLVLVSVPVGLPEMDRARQLCAEVRTFSFGETLQGRARDAMRAQGVITRDSKAFSQGIALPAHTYYEAVAEEAAELSEAAQRFIKLVDRLVRMLEGISATLGPSVKEVLPMDPIEVVDQRRFAYLHRLYLESAGDEQRIVDAGMIRDALGLTREQTRDVIQHQRRRRSVGAHQADRSGGPRG
jgi:hypothetical protein